MSDKLNKALLDLVNHMEEKQDVVGALLLNVALGEIRNFSAEMLNSIKEIHGMAQQTPKYERREEFRETPQMVVGVPASTPEQQLGDIVVDES